MKTSELEFELPVDLIATKPAEPRDAARLMVLDRKIKKIEEATFKDLAKFLKRGDVLVLNITKVFPARIYGKKETGGRVEVVFLSEVKPKVWEVMIGGRISDGSKITFDKDFSGSLNKEDDQNILQINLNSKDLFKKLNKIGEMPLPPYIKRKVAKKDMSDYQTIFAREIGSAAAPTAGLHFTEGLLEKIKACGIHIEYVTLHVGLGTFAPVKTEIVEDHPIHSESYEIGQETACRLNAAKKEGRRIIACGTTVMRTLESSVSQNSEPGGSQLSRLKGSTSLFIYPGYQFKFVDGLITNFHTPRSSLLALVYAFAGKEFVKKAYTKAIEERWRFFSYGDGMLII